MEKKVVCAEEQKRVVCSSGSKVDFAGVVAMIATLWSFDVFCASLVNGCDFFGVFRRADKQRAVRFRCCRFDAVNERLHPVRSSEDRDDDDDHSMRAGPTNTR